MERTTKAGQAQEQATPEARRTRKSPIRIRLRVANRPGQVFRAGKGRGSYRRASAKAQISKQLVDE